MPSLNGPKITKIRDEAIKWYAETRLEMIEALEEERPYGYTEVEPLQQLATFMQMQANPAALSALYASLLERYRGLADASVRAQKDFEDYITRMRLLARELGVNFNA